MFSYDRMSSQPVSELPRNEKRPRFACSASSSISVYGLPGARVFSSGGTPPHPPSAACTQRSGSKAAITYIISVAYMQISTHTVVVCLIVMRPLLTICWYTFTKVSTAPGGEAGALPAHV